MVVNFSDEIKSSHDAVIAKPDQSWVLYSLSTKTFGLLVSETGIDLGDLVGEFESSKIQFAFMKCLVHGLAKYALICWCGDSVPVAGKGQMSQILQDVQSYFSAAHVIMQARTESDVDLKLLQKRLEDAAGAKYNESKNTSAAINKPEIVSKPRVLPPPETFRQDPAKADAPSKPASTIAANWSKPTDPSKPTDTSKPVSNWSKPAESPKPASNWSKPVEAPVAKPTSTWSKPEAPLKATGSSWKPPAQTLTPSDPPKVKPSISVGKLASTFGQGIVDKVQLERERRDREDAEIRERAKKEEQERLQRLDAQPVYRAVPEPVESAPESRSAPVHVPAPVERSVPVHVPAPVSRPAVSRPIPDPRVELEARKREQEEKETQLKREQVEIQRQEQLQREEESRQQMQASHPPSHSLTGASAIVLYDYTADESNEVSLTEGQVVTAIVMVDEGWWEGSTPSGQRGLFPANYVQLQESVPVIPEPEPQVLREPEPEVIPEPEPEIQVPKSVTARALYEYVATEGNELTFNTDDIITNVIFVAEEWWQGTLNGTSGLFPANYVELV